MTITQMRHKIQALKTKLRTVQNTAKGEKRELTDEEQVEFDAVVEEIEQIEADIEAKKEELLALEVDAEDLRTKRDEFDKKVDTPVDDERSKRNKRSFNLTRAIKAVVNNTQFEDVEARAIELGRKYANESGLSYSGQITLPMFEQRDVTAQTGLGIEAIETDVLQILDPLRNNLVLSKAGATIMTGLRGNVQIPIYAGTTAVWNAETNCQTNTQGGFTEKTFSPLRLTAVIDISKQFLIQDSAGAEAMLQRDIVAALSEQLEKTLLGDAAGTATQPAGIGNLITATAITDWQDTVALETALKTANYNGNYTYLLNPYVNGALTVLPKDAGSGIMAITDNKLNGNTVEVTNSVFTKGGIIGDWRQYMVFLWSGIDLTVDTISLAYCGKVRITANMYVNGGPRDLNAFKTFNMA